MGGRGSSSGKAGKRTANVKFTKSNNVPVLRHAQSDTVNLMEKASHAEEA